MTAEEPASGKKPPRASRVVRRVGAVVLALGGLAVLAGFVLNAGDPGPDANIGAGILVVLGAPLALLGAITLVVGVAMSALGRRYR